MSVASGGSTGSGQQVSPTQAELAWKILGLQVGRKTEFIALAAFVLSVSGVLWQVFNYTRGAIVFLFPTDQIVISSTNKLGRNYSGQQNLLSVAATLSYVNDGDTGHNAVIRREYIRFSLGDRPIEHRWYEFVSTDVKEGNLDVKRESEARPFAVTAGSAVSHETLFTAWEIDCEQARTKCAPAQNFVTWDDFINAVKKARSISFTTAAELYGKNSVLATCVVRLRDWELDVLDREQWLAVACSEPNSRPARAPKRTHQARTGT